MPTKNPLSLKITQRYTIGT